MKIRIGLILAFLTSFLQTKSMNAVVSHSIFYTEDSARKGHFSPQLVAYWEVNPSTIHYSTTPEKTIVARIVVEITLSNNAGILAHDRFMLETPPRKSPNELALNHIIDERSYIVSKGLVRFRFRLMDVTDTTNQFVYADSVVITPPEKPYHYSDLQLIDTMLNNPAKTAFLRNGRQVVPICTNFMDDPRHIMHYYGELYGANLAPAESYPLTEQIFIARKTEEGAIGKFLKTDTLRNSAQQMVTGSFDIRYLESGNYQLCAALFDKNKQQIASAQYFFQRMNEHLLVDSQTRQRRLYDTAIEDVKVLDLNKTFVAKYNIVQVKAILRMLLPFSDNNGANTIAGFLKNTDDLYARYYIYNYFLNINKRDPARAWREFSEKIIEVNKKFTAHGTEGFETDRGFVYLRYGEPTDVVTVESEPGSLPYEIWTYNTLTQTNKKDITNAVFLFYRPNEAEEFRLLQSNVAGEVQNPAWRKSLYLNSQGGNGAGGSARAEEYLGSQTN